MSALDEFFANKNWESDEDDGWNYIGNEDPQECVKELRQLQYDAALEKVNEDTNKTLMNVNTQLRAELETMFQATVSVLGDDEHRGHTTERTLELCRNAVVNYINNHPTKEAQNDN